MSNKHVAVKDQTTALATAGEYSYAAVAMHDELDQGSFSIPRIAIIEALSPELEKTAPEYMSDAERGDLSNRTMGEVYKDGIMAIPVKRRRVYLEWVPRKQGGGFVAEHNTADGEALMATTTRNDKNVDVLPSGNELHNVLEFYGLISSDGGETWSPAIISMSRTRMAEGKKWNTRIANFMRGGQPITPLAQVYHLGTASRANAEGQVSYVFKTGPAQFLPEAFPETHGAIFAQAKKFLEDISTGAATVDRDAEAAQAGATAVEEEF